MKKAYIGLVTLAGVVLLTGLVYIVSHGYNTPTSSAECTSIAESELDSERSQGLVTLVYPEEYDTSDSVLRFYNDVTNEYHNVSGVTFGTREVNGNTVTTATYLLKDGSINDTDGVENGVIQDPVGIAVNNEPVQSSSNGSGSQSSGSSSLASTGQQNLVQVLIGLALILTALAAIAQLKYSSRISRS